MSQGPVADQSGKLVHGKGCDFPASRTDLRKHVRRLLSELLEDLPASEATKEVEACVDLLEGTWSRVREAKPTHTEAETFAGRAAEDWTQAEIRLILVDGSRADLDLLIRYLDYQLIDPALVSNAAENISDDRGYYYVQMRTAQFVEWPDMGQGSPEN